jgi:hypothetical protein
VEKAIKEMRDKKATEDDYMPGDVPRVLGEDGIRIIDTTIDNIYETGEWPKVFTKVAMIALKKKPKTTKSSDHRTCRKDSSENI